MYYYYCKEHPNTGFISHKKISKVDLRDYQCSDDCNGPTNQFIEFDEWSDSLSHISPKVFMEYTDSMLEGANYHDFVGMAGSLFHDCRNLIPVSRWSELSYHISMTLLNGVE